MNGTRDNVVLLLFGELVEVYGVARYPYRELGVLLGVGLRVEQRFAVEHVYV